MPCDVRHSFHWIRLSNLASPLQRFYVCVKYNIIDRQEQKIEFNSHPLRRVHNSSLTLALNGGGPNINHVHTYDCNEHWYVQNGIHTRKCPASFYTILFWAPKEEVVRMFKTKLQWIVFKGLRCLPILRLMCLNPSERFTAGYWQWDLTWTWHIRVINKNRCTVKLDTPLL